MDWPSDPVALRPLQAELAMLRPPLWVPPSPLRIGGCFVCFQRGGSGPGRRGDRGWAAAVVLGGARPIAAETTGEAGAPYLPGLLAAREGPLLEAAVRALPASSDVLLVNGAGRDHPRRAGLALHLGWVLDLPTVGVTHRPYLARGDLPGPWARARSPVSIDGEQVGWWFRTRSGARPVTVSPGWRTDLDTAIVVIESALHLARTPEPIRRARRLARTARSRSSER